jgi:hypothetical protein
MSSVQDITGSRTFAAVTPSDTADNLLLGNGKPPKGVYVGVGGDIVAVDWDGTAVTFIGVVTGTILPIRPRRINATSTTATDMVALY